jgi:hypothetical protein
MERDNIKDEVPNESLGEITRLLGQKWKALSKEEKQVMFFFFFFTLQGRPPNTII